MRGGVLVSVMTSVGLSGFGGGGGRLVRIEGDCMDDWFGLRATGGDREGGTAQTGWVSRM